MEFKELDVFSTIPAKRFHSCVLTTYSFDFNYFNHNALTSIKRAGVRNINIFIDDSMLQQSLGYASGFFSLAARKYSISGIIRKGAFHPKLSLFFGRDNHGFMIIGSGNLTSSGHGSNHELWGAFHINGPDDPKAPMFKKAWEYIQSIGNETTGISKRKIEWINTHTPWLKDIPDKEAATEFDLGKEIQAYFLTNSGDGIFHQLKNIIKGDVFECTLISPFLDSKAEILFEFEKLFPDSQIDMILQPDTLAVDLSSKKFSHTQFRDWYTIFQEKRGRYLHAKLVHLRTNSTEYCLFGSANLSTPALGTNGKGPSNEEVCILLKRKSGDWLNELGLTGKGKIVEISELEGAADREELSDKRGESYKCHIKAIDKISQRIRLYIDIEKVQTDFVLVLFDGWGEEIDRIDIEMKEYNKESGFFDLTVNQTILNNLFYAQLYDAENNPVSNKQIIHDMIALSRTNPDQSIQKIEEILDRVEIADAGMVEILNYLDPNDLTTEKHKGSGEKKHNDENETDTMDGSGEVIAYDDFIKIDPGHQCKGGIPFLYGSHSIERTLETLRTVFEKLKIQDVDNASQDEESDQGDIDSSIGRPGEETPEKEIPPQSQSEFLKHQKMITNFFEKYIRILEKQRKQRHKPNILDSSMFTIALHLLLDFYSKPIKIKSKSREEILLRTSGDYFNKNDYCRIVVEIIGKFTLLLINGIDDGNDEYIRQRIAKCKKMAYWHALCCLARLASNMDKVEKDDVASGIWKWELGMNIRDLFAPDNADDEGIAHEEISHRIKLMNCDNDLLVEALCINFWSLIKKSYNQQANLFKGGKKYPLKKGCIIYYPYTGFTHIVKIDRYSSKNASLIEVARPGYPPSQDSKDFKKKRGFMMKRESFKYGRLHITNLQKV